MDPTVINPTGINEDSTVNRVDNSKVDGAKVDVKTTKFKSQDKSKNIKLIKFFLAKR